VLEDLREIARPRPLERAPLDLNAVATGVVESMQSGAATAQLTLALETWASPLPILGDAYGLNRVCQNLLVNAFQATPEHGRVHVRTAREDGMAVIAVADSGSGIQPERLQTIFDGATTKRRGLGLGLMTSKRIVEQLGGAISVTSTVGEGATFYIKFPLAGVGPEAPGVPGSPPPA
jgi:signal transduction histidine kinase